MPSRSLISGAAPALIEVPDPKPAPGEVLVRVHASSVNGFDLAVAGGLKGMMEHRFPVVLGKDFAGTVATTGEGVSGFAAGDEVFGVVMKPFLGDGGLGEYVSVGTGPGARPPPGGAADGRRGRAGAGGHRCAGHGRSHRPAPGRDRAGRGRDRRRRRLRHQLAVARGARVIATARPGVEADFVRGLSAAHTADYTADLTAQVRAIAPPGVDAVLHFAGDAAQLAGLLAERRAVCLHPGRRPGRGRTPGCDRDGHHGRPDQAALDRLAADAAAGRLRVPVTRTYPLAEVPQALADFAAGALGKLAVTIG